MFETLAALGEKYSPLFHGINLVSVLVRSVLASVLGGLIGFERGKKNRPAGFRTYMLVCFGSAVVMMTNQYVYQVHALTDPTRLGAQVISGIGFLGAGSIIVTGHSQVKGLTTAAGLWAAACIGLAVGVGFYSMAIIGGIMIYIIMAGMGRIDTQIRETSRLVVVYLELGKNHAFSDFLTFARENDLEISDVQIEENKLLKNDAICATMVVKTLARHTRTQMLDIIRKAEGLNFVEEI
ncbi:MAG: MgtC/SapB family protein [Spirochaetaceae bacterium]|jgi:putative Mg2+ transporter-C (MgtC) family protein|nr:MgtC/SapB family protein [Spirochaetaceae bacterium]